MERKERLEKILNKNIGNPNHDKEGKFTFAPYKKYPGLQQSVKKLITIKKAEKGLTEKYLKAVDEEREKLFNKFKKSKRIADDELGFWNDGKYMYTWLDQKHEVFSDIDVALSKAILKESKERPTVYRTQVDSENPGKMEKSRYASWSPDLEYVCKWARFLAGYDSKIDVFKNEVNLENARIIPDVLYSTNYLRNKAKYQEYILENKSSIEAFEHGLSRHDVYEKYINSIDLISKDLVPFDFYIKYNGGPGSGNFNPGQGQGVGKPSKGGVFNKSESQIKDEWNNIDDNVELDKDTEKFLKTYYFGSWFFGNVQRIARQKNIDIMNSFEKKQATKTMETLDNLIDKSSLSKDIILFRGITMTDDNANSIKKGSIISDSGFASSTVNPNKAIVKRGRQETGGKRNTVLMKIDAKKGQKALKSPVDTEYEFVLPRNSKFKVKSVSEPDDNNIRIVEVEYE